MTTIDRNTRRTILMVTAALAAAAVTWCLCSVPGHAPSGEPDSSFVGAPPPAASSSSAAAVLDGDASTGARDHVSPPKLDSGTLERVARFLGDVGIHVGMDDVSDTYLSSVDLGRLLACVERSGLRASEVRDCLRSGRPAVEGHSRALLLLAMALAGDYGQEDSRFLVGRVLESGMLFECSMDDLEKRTDVLAAAHALRLRGALGEIARSGFTRTLQERYAARVGQGFTRETKCLLEMLCDECQRGSSIAPEIETLARTLLETKVLYGAGEATAFRVLLRVDEAAALQRLQGLRDDQTWVAVSALPVLNEDRHTAFLSSVLASEYMRPKAMPAMCGLLGTGSAEAASLAVRWLENSHTDFSTQIVFLLQDLPVDNAMRCVASLAGRTFRGPSYQRLHADLDALVKKRLRYLALAPNHRQSIFRQAADMLQRTGLTREGREYCFWVMGAVGEASDMAEIQRLGAQYGLQEAATAAGDAIRARRRR